MSLISVCAQDLPELGVQFLWKELNKLECQFLNKVGLCYREAYRANSAHM